MAGKRKLNSVSYKSVDASSASDRLHSRFPIGKIVSGGQTGVDRAALDFAIAHGIPHGGWCPRGRLAEDGAIASHYELRETPDTEYAQRTEWNVRDSDGTVIFSVSRELTGGSKLTAELAAHHGKPCLHLSKEKHGATAATKLRDFICKYGIRTLNVAGLRLSTEPAAGEFAATVLEEFWTRQNRE